MIICYLQIAKMTACVQMSTNAVKYQRIYLRLSRKSFALWMRSAASVTMELSIS